MGQAKGEKGQKSCENLQSLSRCLYYATLQLDLCTLAEFSHCDWVINLKGSTRFLKPLSHITQANFYMCVGVWSLFPEVKDE